MSISQMPNAGVRLSTGSLEGALSESSAYK